MSLDARVCLVTGAARGLGRAIAERFAESGASLALLDCDGEELAATTDALDVRDAPLQLKADVASWAEVEAALSRVTRAFGRVDVLINNAGVQGPIGPLMTTDPEHWRRTVDVNLLGTLHCTRAVLPAMIENGYGRIVNISGGGATAARPRFSAYAASKAGVVRLAETLALELDALDVRVNAVAPGALNTRMLDEVLVAGEAAGAELEDALRRQRDGGSSIADAVDLVMVLAGDSPPVNGRLVSAPHDAWRTWSEKPPADDAMYTLRRVDAFTLSQLESSD
ncbi:MAG: SDR family NAD(P)-dependent oxidoreductase [Gaiellaceae bacterium]